MTFICFAWWNFRMKWCELGMRFDPDRRVDWCRVHGYGLDYADRIPERWWGWFGWR